MVAVGAVMAAAAALAALSVVFGADGTMTQQNTNTMTQQNAKKNETEPKKKKNQPHIIFILIDDQGYNDIGYHNPNIKTPTLDKLAAEGVILENYYVQPICTPSRSQLLTGRYQIHTGLQHSIIRPSQPSCLPSHLDTLPERLRDAGYATHLVGKWHLGFYRKACLPTRKGFDSFFGSLTGSVDYYSYGSCDGPSRCGYDLHDDEGVAWGHEGRYSTSLFTQRARRILEQHNPEEKPLFLLLALQAVHTPLQSPKSYIYPYRHMANVARRKYAAMVSTVDQSVRNVTYALRKLGYYRNSVIVYSTDNGAQPFTGGSNWPLRGRKGTYWEGGVRGVAFVHSPLLRRRRRVSRALTHITDWFPTLVGLAGGDLSQSRGLDGFDVWDAISEGKDSPRNEILHNIDPLHKPAQTRNWNARASGQKKPTKKKKLKKKKKKKKLKEPKPRTKTKTRTKTRTRTRSRVLPRSPFQYGVKSGFSGSAPAFRISSMRTKFRRNVPENQDQDQDHNQDQDQDHNQNQDQDQDQDQNLDQHQDQDQDKNQDHNQNQNKNQSQSRPPLPKSQDQNQNLSWSRPHQPKSQTPSWSRPQTQNLSQSRPHQPKSQNQNLSWSQNQTLLWSRPPQLKSKNLTWSRPSQTPQTRTQTPVPAPWDPSVQAAIRVGDWKLLTGDPGHGDWVPLQVLPSLPGRWWTLERGVSVVPASSLRKNVWLFNVTADPCERYDRAEQEPDTVRRLMERLAFYNATAVPVYFPPDDPRADPRRRGGAWGPWVEGPEEDKYTGVYKEGKRKRKQCPVCKVKTWAMTNRI